MNKNRALIALAESERTQFGREDFSAQTPDQQVFSAIWGLESQVNNGGFAQYLESSDGECANFAAEALDRIGATQAALIVREALDVFSRDPIPLADEARQSLVESLIDVQIARLEQLEAKFLAYPDNLTDLLFAFVSQKPQIFGVLSE